MLRKAASERDLYRMCTKTFTWRLLTGPELTEVYLNEMRRDFPAGELKPLSMILTSEAEGTAHTDRKSTRLNSSHRSQSRMPSSA